MMSTMRSEEEDDQRNQEALHAVCFLNRRQCFAYMCVCVTLRLVCVWRNGTRFYLDISSVLSSFLSPRNSSKQGCISMISAFHLTDFPLHLFRYVSSSPVAEVWRSPDLVKAKLGNSPCLLGVLKPIQRF